MNVKDHYEHHLGHFYSWMIGDFETRCHEQEAYFRRNKLTPHSGRMALDLGAGNGIQSVPLSRLGYSVKALDFTPQLLEELKQHAAGLDIEVVATDFTIPGSLASFHPELIVCMGDTLSHFESIHQISEMLHELYEHSEDKARVVVSFRDQTLELKEEQRFIPVRHSDNRILTCMMEYFQDHIQVTDLLHEKTDAGWIQTVSSYRKLRLKMETLRNLFACRNFQLLDMETGKGLSYLIFQKKK